MENTNNNPPSVRLSFPKRFFRYSLLIFFKLLYHQFAWSYDVVAWAVSWGNWQKWVEAVLPSLEGPRILEIGFGPGHLQLALQRKEVMVIGLDESQQMVNLTCKRLVKHGSIPVLVRADAQQIPLADECVNQVVMTFPAEFIVKHETMAEIRRVIIPGGKAVVLTMAWITGRKPWERLVAWVNRITSQAPAWDPKLLEQIKPEGFKMGWEMKNFPNSSVVIISLNKV